MEAQDRFLVDLIGKKNSIFYVPFYQRKYTWEAKSEIKQLWEDLMYFTNEQEKINEYFLGTLIIKKTNSLTDKYILVDGQQRITSFLLLIVALVACSNKKRDLDEYITLKSYIDWNQEKAKFKLERINDSNIIEKILKGNIESLSEKEKEFNYFKNYEWFVNKIKSQNDLDDKFIKNFYLKCLEKIKVAVINLNNFEDEFLIFESINSKGKPLTPADLIKNYIISRIENDQEFLEEFDNKFISSFDKYLNPEESIVDFYRQFLAIYVGKLYNTKGKILYSKFKDIVDAKTQDNINHLKDFLKDMQSDKVIYDYIKENNWNYKLYPLFRNNKNILYSIIHVILKFNGSVIDNKYVIENNKNIEYAMNYLAKLSVSKILCTNNQGNRDYASIANKLFKRIQETNNFLNSFNEEVCEKLENSNTAYAMPKWEEVANIELKRNLYSNNSYFKQILISIEEHLNGQKKLNEKDLSVEHIFPQNSSEWNKAVSENIVKEYDSWDEIKTWVHTLGNLSITNSKDNSALSNKTFLDKQKILEERSYLKINKHIYEYNEWTVKSIKDRANKILEYIKEIWF